MTTTDITKTDDAVLIATNGDAGLQLPRYLKEVNGKLTLHPQALLFSDFVASLDQVSKRFAASTLVPEHFRGKPADIFVVAQLALRVGFDLFSFLQHCYVVHGRPGIESKLAIAILQESGRIIGPPRYESGGKLSDKSRWWRCWVTDRETGERIDGPVVDWGLVERERWHLPKGKDKMPSKWTTMPEIMGPYRAAITLIRHTYPGVLMGVSTVEELHDGLEPDLGTTVEDVQLTPDTLARRQLDELAGTGAATPTEGNAEPPQQKDEPKRRRRRQPKKDADAAAQSPPDAPEPPVDQETQEPAEPSEEPQGPPKPKTFDEALGNYRRGLESIWKPDGVHKLHSLFIERWCVVEGEPVPVRVTTAEKARDLRLRELG